MSHDARFELEVATTSRVRHSGVESAVFCVPHRPVQIFEVLPQHMTCKSVAEFFEHDGVLEVDVGFVVGPVLAGWVGRKSVVEKETPQHLPGVVDAVQVVGGRCLARQCEGEASHHQEDATGEVPRMEGAVVLYGEVGVGCLRADPVFQRPTVEESRIDPIEVGGKCVDGK